ncbi:hypothetical protein E2C01_070799 [Portunus trituberculatus]|uniref:Uncharacterized protein n=1 Tax=Portunus trituberculatus TaxID=210409 RepID=A0A5B7I3E4_PORTR|nr:hypothetical protein [Portunus trituberculatus]
MAHLLFSACPLMNNYKPSPAKLHPCPALPPTRLHPLGTHTAHEAPTNNRPTSPLDLRLSGGVNRTRSTSIPCGGVERSGRGQVDGRRCGRCSCIRACIL